MHDRLSCEGTCINATISLGLGSAKNPILKVSFGRIRRKGQTPDNRTAKETQKAPPSGNMWLRNTQNAMNMSNIIWTRCTRPEPQQILVTPSKYSVCETNTSTAFGNRASAQKPGAVMAPSTCFEPDWLERTNKYPFGWGNCLGEKCHSGPCKMQSKLKSINPESL